MDNLTREDLQARLEQYQAEKDFGDHHVSIEPDDLIGIIETTLALMDDHEGFEGLLQRKDFAIDNLQRDAHDWKSARRKKTAQHEALRDAVEVLAKRDGWRHCTHPEGHPVRVLIELLDGKEAK